MWIPMSAEDIEAAARAGDLEETASFDGKRGLPPPNKNRDMAVDIAAMTTEGGVIVYGLGEDQHKRLTILAPFALAGSAERIDQIVQTSIMEVPYIETRPLFSNAESGVGYLVVVVPQSARAPHQVVVGDDRRFYGRGATGNRRLPEGEIARLYQRRQSWEQDRDELLRAAVKSSRFTGDGGMIGFARPVLPDCAIWNRAVTIAGGRDELHDKLHGAAKAPQTASGYDPSFTSRSILTWYQRGADEVSLSTLREDESPNDATWALEASFRVDGSAQFFSARAVAEDRSSGSSMYVIMEIIVAGNFASFLAMVSALYDVVGYHGQVDVGAYVNGLLQARSFRVRDDFRGWFRGQPYNAPEFRRTERVAAVELREPKIVAARMLRPLFELTTGNTDFDPFA